MAQKKRRCVAVTLYLLLNTISHDHNSLLLLGVPPSAGDGHADCHDTGIVTKLAAMTIVSFLDVSFLELPDDGYNSSI